MTTDESYACPQYGPPDPRDAEVATLKRRIRELENINPRSGYKQDDHTEVCAAIGVGAVLIAFAYSIALMLELERECKIIGCATTFAVTWGLYYGSWKLQLPEGMSITMAMIFNPAFFILMLRLVIYG